jgi:ASPIC/UnbV protein
VKVVPRIDVLWPSGTKQTLTDVAANQILTIDEPK